jgi:anthranilate phosphoribosyltransferase
MMRSISIEELSGFRDALLELCIRVDLSDYNTIDLCGTGGDGKHFNISTLASFVAAGAGVKCLLNTVIMEFPLFLVLVM